MNPYEAVALQNEAKIAITKGERPPRLALSIDRVQAEERRQASKKLVKGQ
jgi:hypothetical protein